MTIKFRDFTINTDLFESPSYIRDFDLIAFTTAEGLLEQRLTLNLCFDSMEAARTTFFTIRRNLLNGTRMLDLSGTACSWPRNLAHILESYVDFYSIPTGQLI